MGIVKIKILLGILLMENKAKAEKFKWPKSILSFNSAEDAAECAARVYFSIAHCNPESSIILPTDRSATMIFNAMKHLASEYADCPFGNAHILSDTETFGVYVRHPASRTRHINDLLIKPLKEMHRAPKKENLKLLDGIYTQTDPLEEAKKTIRDFPPSVHAISISPRGEILAYDINTYKNEDDIIDDSPRLVYIGDIGKNYIDDRQPSNLIISIGLGTALSTRVLMILVFETQKADMLHTMLTRTATPSIPATLLQYHQNAYILTTDNIVNRAQIDETLITHVKNAREAAETIAKSQESSHGEYQRFEIEYADKTPNTISDVMMDTQIDSVFKDVLDKIGATAESCRRFVEEHPSQEDISYLRRKAEMEVWEQLRDQLLSLRLDCSAGVKRDIKEATKFLRRLRKRIEGIFAKVSKEIESSLRGADKDRVVDVKTNLEKMISNCNLGE